MSTSQRDNKEPVPERLNPREYAQVKAEVLDDLEHVVLIGHVQRQRHTKPPPTPLDSIAPPRGCIHAADQRQYPHITTWPTPELMQGSDQAWDEECGDGIDINYCLGANENPSTTPSSGNNAPQVLLQRCWERAMTAASSSVTWTNSAPPPPRPMPRPAPDYQRSTAKQWFHKLGYSLPKKPPFVCRACDGVADSREALQDHFFGTRHARGCFWPWWVEEQRRWVARELQKHVTEQTERVVEAILITTEHELEQGAGRPLGWQHVLKAVAEQPSAADKDSDDTVDAFLTLSEAKIVQGRVRERYE